jgi:hypothetical protein
MRVLALARYRLLRTVRSAHAVFAVALVAAAFPLAVRSDAFTVVYATWEREHSRLLMPEAAQAGLLTYGLHLFILIMACSLFGMRRRSEGGEALSDLIETVPATASDRFFGDAAGVLGAVLAIHVCVLPMLALAVILSPLPTSAFFWLEAMTLAVAVLVSAGTAGNLHAHSKWQQTQLARSMVTFLVLAVVILRFTTHWQSFSDAALLSFTQPSPSAWNAVPAAITSPEMLLAAMSLLYGAFIAWFAMRTVRSLEQG